jgi:hypothetical protein
MKTNRKTHHRRMLSDTVRSAPIALLLALLFIATAAVEVRKFWLNPSASPREIGEFK